MSSFNIFSIVWIAIAVITFCSLFFVVAPYGRHIKKGWGPNISARLGWVFMESPCVILMLGLAIFAWEKLNLVHLVFLIIWLSHYVHRTFIWPFKADMLGKDMPITIALSAFFFNIVNVSIQGYWIFYFVSYSVDWLSSPFFITGVLIFFIGMYINIRSDYILINLRKEKGPGYHVANTFLYKHLSCPNYFGELLEWMGWAILTYSLSGFVFFLWTFANLFPRAIANHKWYKKQFKQYPQSRKAVIPWII
jgi:protein-S-isoprenylcysteine O-methyltransferase Ste14